MPFSPYGYDERQYCSPGYDLPVGCFMRSPNGSFRQYHTSGDNLDFVTPAALEQSLDVLIDVIGVLERNMTFARVDGRGEPQLGRRGLYRALSGQKDHADRPDGPALGFEPVGRPSFTARYRGTIRHCL